MHRLVVTNQAGAIEAIARGIDRALGSGLRVLWLLSGGSNIVIQLEALQRLQNATQERLRISMIDERFVPLTDPDSNWKQLLDAGLTDEKATLEPPITQFDDLTAAAADYAKRLTAMTNESDVVIGQFGLGSDGHVAGILPHSPGVHEQQHMVIGYQGADFPRITITPAYLPRLTLALGVAMGEAKRPILERMPTDIPADEQPAQLLLLALELIMYTDQPVHWT